MNILRGIVGDVVVRTMRDFLLFLLRYLELCLLWNFYLMLLLAVHFQSVFGLVLDDLPLV